MLWKSCKANIIQINTFNLIRQITLFYETQLSFSVWLFQSMTACIILSYFVILTTMCHVVTQFFYHFTQFQLGWTLFKQLFLWSLTGTSLLAYANLIVNINRGAEIVRQVAIQMIGICFYHSSSHFITNKIIIATKTWKFSWGPCESHFEKHCRTESKLFWMLDKTLHIPPSSQVTVPQFTCS